MTATLAWGENREIHGNQDGYLVEWDWRVTRAGSFYGRAESVAKDILDLGSPSPPGFADFHRISHVDALTLGYVHDLTQAGSANRSWRGRDSYIISSDLGKLRRTAILPCVRAMAPADDPMMKMMMPMIHNDTMTMTH